MTVGQATVDPLPVGPDCADKKANHKWDDCMCGQVCEMVRVYNESQVEKKKLEPSPSEPGADGRDAYEASIGAFEKEFAAVCAKHHPDLDHAEIKAKFYSPPEGKPPPPVADCQHAKWKASGGSHTPARSGPGAMNPDHMHPANLNGPLTSANLKWADSRVNYTVGGGMKKIKTAPQQMQAHSSCKCT
jgi:hypothetical protein